MSELDEIRGRAAYERMKAEVPGNPCQRIGDSTVRDHVIITYELIERLVDEVQRLSEQVQAAPASSGAGQAAKSQGQETK